MNKLISTKHRVFGSFIGLFETGKSKPIYVWLKNGTKIWQTFFIFYQRLQPPYDVMQEEIDILLFVQGKDIEFTDSLKNNGKKYLLICDDACEEICNSKAFVDIATAGNIVDWVIFTLGTISFIEAALGETLSSKTRNFFSSKPAVMWCKSARLVHSWVSDHS